jgi:hypothetical protein
MLSWYRYNENIITLTWWNDTFIMLSYHRDNNVIMIFLTLSCYSDNAILLS